MPESTTTEDKRLDRLLDYTKFHIGVYLSIGGGAVGLITAAANSDPDSFLRSLIGCPWAVAIGAALMTFAGFAGGVIASSCAVLHSFDELWRGDIGPYRWHPWTGETWALIEHSLFWISLLLLAIGVLSGPAVSGLFGFGGAPPARIPLAE